MRSAVLPALFDERVETAEVDPYVDPLDELLPPEANILERAVPDRLLEFRAGRHCARRAMHRLGVAGPVLRAADRSPIFPSGIVGSIAHTRRNGRGFCGAAVARTTEVRSIGLDVEVDRPLEPKLWHRILRPNEADWIASRRPEERGFWALFIFSAKESVYKCQYTLSKTFLEFRDVAIDEPRGDGEFSATLIKDAGPFQSGRSFDGRYARQSGLIATGVTLPA